MPRALGVVVGHRHRQPRQGGELAARRQVGVVPLVGARRGVRDGRGAVAPVGVLARRHLHRLRAAVAARRERQRALIARRAVVGVRGDGAVAVDRHRDGHVRRRRVAQLHRVGARGGALGQREVGLRHHHRDRRHRHLPRRRPGQRAAEPGRVLDHRADLERVLGPVGQPRHRRRGRAAVAARHAGPVSVAVAPGLVPVLPAGDGVVVRVRPRQGRPTGRGRRREPRRRGGRGRQGDAHSFDHGPAVFVLPALSTLVRTLYV